MSPIQSKKSNPPQIGTLNEKPLHEALKKWYARPKDKFEVPVDGSIVDIVRGKLLIEIQTKNFSAIRHKLEKLLVKHKVRLVYPVAGEKWIIKQPQNKGDKATRRRSPKRGVFSDIFDELVYIPRILLNPNFSLELLLIQEEEVREYNGIRGWRRGGWVTSERRLVKVVGQHVIKSPADIAAFIPRKLAIEFTTSELAKAAGKTRRTAQKMVYCLKQTGCIKAGGKRGRAILYERDI